MAWFNNHYQCVRCARTWQSEWSCMCDDDCPFCGARHMTPTDSDDMTEIVRSEEGSFLVLRSPDDAEHEPVYTEVDRFDSSEAAAAYLAGSRRLREHS